VPECNPIWPIFVSDDENVENLKHMMQRAEVGLLPLAVRSSGDGSSDAAAGAAGLGLKVRARGVVDRQQAHVFVWSSCSASVPHPFRLNFLTLASNRFCP
jgi:hypothetical protein